MDPLPEKAMFQELEYRSIFLHSAAPLATLTPEGRFLRVNPALARLVGYSQDELAAITLMDLTPHAERPGATRELAASQAEAGLPGELELSLKPRRGEAFRCRVAVSWVKSASARVLHGVASLTRLAPEQRLAERDLELAHA